MGDIRLSVGQVNITDHLLIVFREVQNPNAIVRQLDIFPVPDSFNVFETDFNPVVHYIDFRNSTDGVSLGTLLSTFVYDVKNQRLIGERRYYKVDGEGDHDPESGTMVITDPYLDGKTLNGVFKENFRYLVPETEWTHEDDTVTLLVGGEFQPDEVVMVEITYLQDIVSASNAFPSGVVIAAGDMGITASEYNKMIKANGSGLILTLTMPDFITIPDGVQFLFNTDGGDQRYVTIDLPDGTHLLDGGKQRNPVYMGKGEQLTVYKEGSVLHVINWTPGDHRRVGERVFTEALNSISETTGSWELIEDWPRFFYWYVNELPPTELGTGTQDVTPDAANRTKFIIGSTKFWMPDIKNHHLRVTDGTRKPGDVQAAQVGEVSGNLSVPKGHSYTGGPNVLRMGNGANTPQDFNLPFSFNAGKENRVLNVATHVYRII